MAPGPARRRRCAGPGVGARHGPAAAAGRSAWPSPRGPAFSFLYEENLELLEAAGAELAPVRPAADQSLPEGTARALPGRRLPRGARRGARGQRSRCARRSRAFAAAGGPVVAECGGLLYLCRELDGHPMCGVLDARARMTDAPDPRLPRGRGARRLAARPRAGTALRGPRVPLLRARARRRPAPRRGACARGGAARGGVRPRRRARELPAHPLGGARPGAAGARLRRGRRGVAA